MTSPRGIDALGAETLELESGARISTVELPNLHRSVIAARIKVGSAYESQRHNGVSHFLEHMLFRGTSAHPTAHDLAAAFESLGGTLEAATSEDHGIMSISLPPESTPAALELFCEVLTKPRFTEIAVERDIVREEILESLDDQGVEIDATSRCRKLCFGEHPLGFPIAGTLDALDTLDNAVVLEHHRRHYTGRNLALVVAGPIESRQAFAAAQRGLGGLEPGQDPVTPALSAQRNPRFEYVKHTASQTSLSICYRAHGRSSELEPATDMLLRVLDDGLSTRLYHRICDELGLCYDAGAGYQAFADAGVFEFGAETAHERAGVLLDELLKMAAELAAHGPREDELERARRRCRWQFDSMLDDPESIAHFFASATLAKSGQTPARRCEELCDVSRSAALKAAEQVFRRENLSVVAVGLLRGKQRDRLEAMTLGAAGSAL